MPEGDGEAQYFSYNLGPAHIVAFSSEFYYFTNYGWRQIENQYNWLIKDLAKANLPENRAKQPWIIGRNLCFPSSTCYKFIFITL